jgi:hypothetical protein
MPPTNGNHGEYRRSSGGWLSVATAVCLDEVVAAAFGQEQPSTTGCFMATTVWGLRSSVESASPLPAKPQRVGLKPGFSA